MGYIDLTQSPYSCTTPWQGNDASSPDYGAQIDQAISDAKNGNTGLIDTCGGAGARILFPPFPISSGRKHVLPPGVSFEGHGRASSTLVMRTSFTAGQHFLDLGDSSTGYAAFGSQITKMHICSQKGTLAHSGDFIVFSNNAQDTKGIVSDCIIDGGSHFGGIKYLDGVGGASQVNFDNLVCNSRAAALALGNVPMVIRVGGSTTVNIENYEPATGWLNDDVTTGQATPGSYGLLCLGGSFRLKQFNFEAVETGIYFGQSDGDVYANSMADVYWMKGNGGLKRMIQIAAAPIWKNRIWLNKIMRNGGWTGPLVNNQQPIGVGYPGGDISADIMEQIKL